MQSVAQGQILLYPGHCFFPKDYLTLYEIPFLIRMLGSPVWLTQKGLSIVGGREPGQATLDWMNLHLTTFFRRQNGFTISGGARGVDQKTHSISLRTQTPTVAILPSGLSQIYPSSFQDLIPDILQSGGAILSEYEDSQKMQKYLFAQRNRLIAGLGRATLILEAGRRSGTMLTAREAIEQSKPLWILPGHPMEWKFQGSLDLLIEGGTPVRDADDLTLLFESETQTWTDFLTPHSDLSQLSS